MSALVDKEFLTTQSRLQEFIELLDELLGEDCYIHDQVIIGKDAYYVYHVDEIDKIKNCLINKYEKVLKENFS